MNSKMKTVFFVLALLVVAWLYFGQARAGETTLSWTLPTASEACSPDATVPDIASTKVWQLVGTGGPTDTELTLTGLMPGDYEYVASVVDTSGAVSRFSGVATKTVGPLVTQTTVAYTVVKTGGEFVALSVGTVPLGTACNEDSMFKGKLNFQPFTGYGVPVSSVTVTGDIELTAAFADCL